MRRSSSYYYRRKSKFSFIKTLLKTFIWLTILGVAVIIFTPTPFYKDGFKNLKELQIYAAQTNEQTPMENTDTLRPEFTKYYQSQIPTLSQKIKNKINLLLYIVGIGEKPVWSTSFFKTVLEDTTKIRETMGCKDNVINKIQTDPTSKFVIFGNMQGAFHSLVRCLTKIKELGIIGDDLKITNPSNYIIFMGDVIDRSPFTLEILTAVTKLIEINPQNVIYLRGNHESKNYWMEHTLKTELQIRAANLSKETVPLEKEVNAFFNTLPLAIYLTIPNTKNDFVRISEFGRSENEMLTESHFADFLTQVQSTKLSHLVLKEKGEPKDIPIKIKAVFRNEKKRKTFQKMEGLRQLSPDMDSVAWNILSCPTVVYQKALDFYNDAFVVLSAADRIEDWEVSLYSHDVRTKDPFKETKFNFISGLDVEEHKKLAAKLQALVPTMAPQPQVQQRPATEQPLPTQPIAPQAQTVQPEQQTVVQTQPIQPQEVQSGTSQAQISQPQVVEQQPQQQHVAPQEPQSVQTLPQPDINQPEVITPPAEQHPPVSTPATQQTTQ